MATQAQLDAAYKKVVAAAKAWRKAADKGYSSRDHSYSHMQKVDAHIRKLQTAHQAAALKYRALEREGTVSNPQRRRTATRKRNAASTSGKLIPAKVRVGKDGTVRVFVNPRHLPKANPTTYGTSYFTSRGAAERYYKQYGYADVKSAVSSKIREGEIHIGKPKLKAGQRLITLDGGKRYGITEG